MALHISGPHVTQYIYMNPMYARYMLCTRVCEHSYFAMLKLALAKGSPVQFSDMHMLVQIQSYILTCKQLHIPL